MPTSQYRAFAVGGGSGSPNVLSTAAYLALTQLIANGFQSGTALSEQINTVLRQASVPAAALAKFAADYGGADVLDDGSINNFEIRLKAALDALYVPDLSPFLRADSFTGSPEQSITSNGWQKLPGGLLVQWGLLAMPSGDNSSSAALLFPRAFANGCYFVTAIPDGPAASGWNPLTVHCTALTASGCAVVMDTGNTGVSVQAGRNCRWFALGFDNSI